MLAFAQPGQQHGLPVRKLQGIVMRQRILVELTEASYFLPEFVAEGIAPDIVVFNVVLKSDLRTRPHTHRHVWVSNFGEATVVEMLKLCRYQLVRDLCRPGCNEMQTVVAHGSTSLVRTAGMVVLLSSKPSKLSVCAAVCNHPNRKAVR